MKIKDSDEGTRVRILMKQGCISNHRCWLRRYAGRSGILRLGRDDWPVRHGFTRWRDHSCPPKVARFTQPVGQPLFSRHPAARCRRYYGLARPGEGIEFGGIVGVLQGLHHRAEVAFHDLGQVVQGESDAVVGEAALREIVGPDAFGPVT
jgi:hypothetical protein